jgi:hypothetical protein
LPGIDPVDGGIDDAEYGRRKHYPENGPCKVENQGFSALWHLKFLEITGFKDSGSS